MMINEKWVSTVVNNFFNEYNIQNNDSLVEFISYYLDILQNENFKNETMSPLYFINNIHDILDIDKFDNRELYEQLIPKELEYVIDETITWKNFIKISKKVFHSKGDESNFRFWLDLIAEYDFNVFHYENDDEISILKKIGIKEDNYTLNNTIDSFFTYGRTQEYKIPNIYSINNIQMKDDFTINTLSDMIDFIKPLGVIFLILNIISNQSVIIDVIDSDSRHSKMYDSELKIYPHYTDIGLVDNIYQLEDFTLNEIDLVLLDDIINNDTDLIYNYKPIYEILVSP